MGRELEFDKTQGEIRALLFDLGGVIFNIDFFRAWQIWGCHSGIPGDLIASRFKFDHFYERHERGEISALAYFESLRTMLEIDITDNQFEEGWLEIFLDEVNGIVPLLQKLKSSMPIYAFSNTNNLHFDFWTNKYSTTLKYFEQVFVSCDLGLRKPEPQAFRRVAEAIGYPLNNILFFDDTLVNVQGALKVGMQAVLVESISDIENAT